MDIQKTRAIRNEIRMCIPAFETGIVDDDSLSAALATLCELLVFRVMNSKGQAQGQEAIALMKEANDLVSGAMEAFLTKHLPESTIFKMFKTPGDVPPGKR